MKKITPLLLKSLNACSSGEEYYITLKTQDAEKIINQCLVDDHLDWANWLIVRIMNQKQKIECSIFAAEQVIDIYEKQYPDNKSPRLAIEAAKAVFKRDTKKNRDAAARASANASDAADASANAAYASANASDAAYAADAAARAAYASADASDAAANASDAARSAARSAANAAYAADAAARAANAEMQKRIIANGLKILKGIK